MVSFGTDQDFGDEQEYLDWLEKEATKYPDGFVLLTEYERPIGQL
ncbi:hypothetical protein [Peribacillus sp. SCS-155]